MTSFSARSVADGTPYRWIILLHCIGFRLEYLRRSSTRPRRVRRLLSKSLKRLRYVPLNHIYRRPFTDSRVQIFITFMDALRLNLRTKEELHPLLRDLVTSCSKFKGHKDSEGRSRMVSWLITLNGMQISERLSDEQSRQLLFDIEHAYNEFFQSLSTKSS